MVGFMTAKAISADGESTFSTLINIEEIRRIVFIDDTTAEIVFIGSVAIGKDVDEVVTVIQCNAAKKEAIINFLTEHKLFHKL